jgi:uncharacterized protein YbjT (DUF2867 family)
MANRILVTGAPGTVGTELVRLVADRGLDARVMVHHIERSGEVAHPGLEIVEGDLADVGSMSRALSGVDTLFLCSSAAPNQAEVQNGAIRTAVNAGVRRIVKISAYGADPRSNVPFFAWHGQTEEALKESGVSWTLIQPYLYMQPLLQNVPSILGQGAIFNCGDGSHIPFVDARDVAAAALGILTSSGHDGEVYTLTGPASLTWPDIAAAIGEQIGSPVAYVPVPPDGMAGALTAAGMPDWLIRSLVALMQFHQGDAGKTTNDVKKLSGRDPRPLKEFLANYAQAFESALPANTLRS